MCIRDSVICIVLSPRLCAAVLVSACLLCSYYRTESVLIALGITAAVCISISLFAIQTKVCTHYWLSLSWSVVYPPGCIHLGVSTWMYPCGVSMWFPVTTYLLDLVLFDFPLPESGIHYPSASANLTPLSHVMVCCHSGVERLANIVTILTSLSVFKRQLKMFLCKHSLIAMSIMIGNHIFPQSVEFWAVPRNLLYCCRSDSSRGIFFHMENVKFLEIHIKTEVF